MLPDFLVSDSTSGSSSTTYPCLRCSSFISSPNSVSSGAATTSGPAVGVVGGAVGAGGVVGGVVGAGGVVGGVGDAGGF